MDRRQDTALSAGGSLALEAQSSIIGSLLIDDRCAGGVMASIGEDDFSSGAHKNTFRAIKRLFASGRAVDPTLVLDAMGGGERYIQFLRECMELTPTAANVLEYCAILRTQTRLLRLREVGEELARCHDREKAQALVSRANALMSDTKNTRIVTAAEAAMDFHGRMRDPSPPKYLTWGLPTLDRALYAEPGDMILIGGRPSAGKTLLSVSLALHQAREYRVGYFSLETRTRKLVDRAIASMAQVPLPRIKEKSLDSADWQSVSRALAAYGELKLEHIDESGITVDDIFSIALSRRYQIIYVDYMQLIHDGAKSSYERVSNISKALHTAAQRNEITVVALAQLSRETMTKSGKPIPPSMSDFRDSGQIEQDADVALLLWLEDPNDYRSDRVLKIGKNKEGTRQRLTLAFDGPCQTVRERAAGPRTGHDEEQVGFRDLPEGTAVPF